MTDLCLAALVTVPLDDTPRQYETELTSFIPTWTVDYKRIVYVDNFWTPLTNPQWGAFGDN